MKVNRRRIWMALAVPMVGLHLATQATVRAVEPTDTPEPPREGACEGAQELFPDSNPGPGALREIAVPEPTGLVLACWAVFLITSVRRGF